MGIDLRAKRDTARNEEDVKWVIKCLQHLAARTSEKPIDEDKFTDWANSLTGNQPFVPRVVFCLGKINQHDDLSGKTMDEVMTKVNKLIANRELVNDLYQDDFVGSYSAEHWFQVYFDVS